VYNLGSPTDTKEYLHRAGRAGRIGSTTGGLVTSIVTPEELEQLTAITEQLGVTPVIENEQDQGLGLAAAEGGDLDAMKRGLEDIFRLF